MTGMRPKPPVARVTLEEKVWFLREPAAYPEPTGSVAVIETHMSWVFLTDRFVYKLKKPVRYAYLDFSTLEARRRDCEREVSLNRPLAGDVYLGTVPLIRMPDGGLRLGGTVGGTEAVVEWLVKMRRLPAARMLDVLIREDKVDPHDLHRLALRLAGFYRNAPRAGWGAEEYRARLARNIAADRDVLCAPCHRLPRERVRHITGALLRTLAEQAGLFARRVQEGRIVEAHGDLRPQHICLTPTPVVIDCLEFNREFRLLDVADELAYLAIECERLGAPRVGEAVLACCGRALHDAPPPALIRFYKARQACLRAKIAVWHTEDHGVQDPAAWRRRAAAYLDLAARYVRDQDQRTGAG